MLTIDAEPGEPAGDPAHAAVDDAAGDPTAPPGDPVAAEPVHGWLAGAVTVVAVLVDVLGGRTVAVGVGEVVAGGLVGVAGGDVVGGVGVGEATGAGVVAVVVPGTVVVGVVDDAVPDGLAGVVGVVAGADAAWTTAVVESVATVGAPTPATAGPAVPRTASSTETAATAGASARFHDRLAIHSAPVWMG